MKLSTLKKQAKASTARTFTVKSSYSIAWGLSPVTSINRHRLAAFLRGERSRKAIIRIGRSRYRAADGAYEIAPERNTSEIAPAGNRCPGCGAATKLFTGSINRPLCFDKFTVFESGNCQCDFAIRDGKWVFFVNGIVKQS